MSIDPFREVRDAVRPSAAAGQLHLTRATQIATRYRVDEADVRRIYREEHARLHLETAEPDTQVGASAPPAVAEDEPTPTADLAERVERIQGRVGRIAAHADQIADLAATVHEPDPPMLSEALGYDLTYDPAVDPPWMEHFVEDASPAAVDRTNVDRALACVAEIAAAHATDPVGAAAARALAELAVLQDVICDHHRQADLVAERAVLAARLAEIDAALGYDAADHVNDPESAAGVTPADSPADDPAPEPPPGGGRANCPECGKEFYVNGLPRHRATHKKQRGAA